MLNHYNEKDIPLYVAIGMIDDVVSCVCGKNIKFDLLNYNEQAKYKLIITKQKAKYSGNFKEKKQ